MKVAQYDISDEGEDGPTMIESGDLMRWTWTVTTCPSTANLLQRMGSEVDTEKSDDSGAGDSVVNPDDWPNVDSNETVTRLSERKDNDTRALKVKR